MTRDEVQEAFGAAPDDGGPSDRMADEIVRLRAILAALREPSLEIRDAVIRVLNNRSVTDTRLGEDIDEIIEAAVAAAEREATNDR